MAEAAQLCKGLSGGYFFQQVWICLDLLGEISGTYEEDSCTHACRMSRSALHHRTTHFALVVDLKMMMKFILAT